MMTDDRFQALELAFCALRPVLNMRAPTGRAARSQVCVPRVGQRGRPLHTVLLRIWREMACLLAAALQEAAMRLMAGRCAARSSPAPRALWRW